MTEFGSELAAVAVAEMAAVADITLFAELVAVAVAEMAAVAEAELVAVCGG